MNIYLDASAAMKLVRTEVETSGLEGHLADLDGESDGLAHLSPR